MQQITDIFGHGKDLTILQMGCRGILVFVITLVLIRISGRRSFGIRTPLDNIIVLLLGAMLSRGIAGVSPFLPVVVTSFILVLLHRLLGWLLIHSEALSSMVEGKKIILFKDGEFLSGNMKKGIVCEKDILQGLRKTALTENLERIERIYIEPSGEISAIKKVNSD